MTKLEVELKRYKLRETLVQRKREELQQMEMDHSNKTVQAFGIAPGRTATVESMIEAIVKVTALAIQGEQ
jgi:hypothetical protein